MEALSERQPRNPQVLFALGRFHTWAGEPAAAVRSYQRLVEVDGGTTGARLLLAEAQLATGDLAAARKSYEDLVNVAPDDPVVWNNLAWLYQQAGDRRAAVHGERALELAPDQPAVMDTLGWILLDEEGEVERAAELLEQAHRAAPANADIAYHYATALHRTGNDAAAREILQPLLQSDQPFSAKAEAAALLESLAP
jgi:Flp pilus assembly protein TadD